MGPGSRGPSNAAPRFRWVIRGQWSSRRILETERLISNTWRISDWTALRSIATDTQLMRYITGGTPWTEDPIQSFVERQVQLHSERGFCRWKLLAKRPSRQGK